MARRTRPCPEPTCTALILPGESDCPHGHRTRRAQEGRARADAHRPTASERGYGAKHRRFRTAVLARDGYRCVLCGARANHADHHPLTRRELEARGMNPDDPRHGRALCHSCHSSETARHDGGFGNPIRT